MKEIDEVIEKHGGWPGAFAAGLPGEALDAAHTALDPSIAHLAGES